MEVPPDHAHLREPVASRFDDVGPVGDDRARAPIDPLDVVGDGLGVGDHHVRASNRRLLRPPVVGGSRSAPLLALGLQSVQVHRDGDAGGSQRPEEWSVSRVQHQRHIRSILDSRVRSADGCVAECFGHPMPHGWQIHQSHALVLGDRLAWIAAIHRDVVSTPHQALADLLDGGLEAAVRSGHSTSSQDRHRCGVRTIGHVLSACGVGR